MLFDVQVEHLPGSRNRGRVPSTRGSRSRFDAWQRDLLVHLDLETTGTKVHLDDLWGYLDHEHWLLVVRLLLLHNVVDGDMLRIL